MNLDVKGIIAKIVENEAKKVDFDLDNWIGDFEDGFPRFEKINPTLKANYWGQTFEHRPRIKELNEEVDAQEVEGYRLVEFFPDRENKDESYLIFGTPLEIMTQCSMLMNMHLKFQQMDIGAFLGYPIEEYLRNKPRTGITIQIRMTTKKTPPFYKKPKEWFLQRYLHIPLVDKAKLSYQALRNACGGSNGQNWGEWHARAYIATDDEKDPIRQMVCGGSSEKTAVANLEKFLTFTQAKVKGMTVNKIRYDKGTRAKEPNKSKYNSYDVYPAWITVLNSKLVALDDARNDGKKTLSGGLVSRQNKLYLYSETMPPGWDERLREFTKKAE